MWIVEFAVCRVTAQGRVKPGAFHEEGGRAGSQTGGAIGQKEGPVSPNDGSFGRKAGPFSQEEGPLSQEDGPFSQEGVDSGRRGLIQKGGEEKRRTACPPLEAVSTQSGGGRSRTDPPNRGQLTSRREYGVPKAWQESAANGCCAESNAGVGSQQTV